MSLTARQLEAERFIREYLETHGYSPSVADVAAWLGVSRTMAHRHLVALKRKGRIVATRSVARSIRVVCACQPLEKRKSMVG